MLQRVTQRMEAQVSNAPAHSPLSAFLADPNISSALRAALKKPEQIAEEQRQAYIGKCAQTGREIDPVMADETYWRALRRAQGLSYYSGD